MTTNLTRNLTRYSAGRKIPRSRQLHKRRGHRKYRCYHFSIPYWTKMPPQTRSSARRNLPLSASAGGKLCTANSGQFNFISQPKAEWYSGFFWRKRCCLSTYRSIHAWQVTPQWSTVRKLASSVGQAIDQCLGLNEIMKFLPNKEIRPLVHLACTSS